jgi:lysyl-tRNA synthetase, class II
MTDPKKRAAVDENAIVAERRAKLARMRAESNPYPNDFSRTHTALPVKAKYGKTPGEELERQQVAVTIAGRLMSKRVLGDTSFGIVEDTSGRIQIAVSDDASGRASHAAYAQWDSGDIVGVEGILYRPADGELTIRVHAIRLLVKALRPPEEHASDGDDDALASRPRYAQLMVNPRVRRLFAVRSRALQGIRQLFSATHYMEVETPMLQPVPGTDAARTFETHHNALGMALYLRGSAIPYLARLAVGGMEKIYEINRSFRNDGRFVEQGFELTMMEIYCAYSSYLYMMALLELVIARAAKASVGSTTLTWHGHDIDLGKPFARISTGQAIRNHAPSDWTDAQLRDREFLGRRLSELGVQFDEQARWGALHVKLFHAVAARHLIQPAFVVDFPFDEIALARRSNLDPELAEGFELFIGGRAIAEGASVINDAAELDGRVTDAEFIRAVEYGLPPASSAALSFDMLAMLLTGSTSLRDVILFPGTRQ